MAVIAVLDKQTAEQIAAGEVVERPASVAKELIENAIDAGATAITVDVRGGGVTGLTVTDNGCGIAREDVPVAFQRHATSKIRTADDLESIGTLGFRGEALASVSAVARVDLVTRMADDLAGTHYVIEGGDGGVPEDVGCAVGTTVAVRDLFYNIPARLKFLKKDVSEGNAVAAVVERLALSHPEIAFRLVREGKEELVTPGDGSLHNCVYAVLGRQFARELLTIDHTENGIRVHGYISKPTNGRASRTLQHMFINHRYVHSRTVAAALEEGFRGHMMVGKFPGCVLFVDLSPAVVDVNVHPAKIEVRFVQERPVFEAVFHGVRAALAQSPPREEIALPTPSATRATAAASAAEPIPAGMPATPWEAWKNATVQLHDSGKAQFTWPGMYRRSSADVEPPTDREKAAIVRPDPDVPPKDAPVAEVTAETVPAAETAEQVTMDAAPAPARVLGEVFDTYIVAQWDDQLLLVDKHALHERLLYDRLRAEAHTASQQLLAPVDVSLSREEYAAVVSSLPLLAQAGFEVEDFGGHTVLIRAVPLLAEGTDPAALLEEIAGGLAGGRQDITADRLEWIYHSTACRAAVKAGDGLSQPEREALVAKLCADDQLRTCPHGRPVCFTLSRKTLEKQFGRST